MTVIAMSRTEIDRMSVLQDLAANRIKVAEAATLMRLGRRQVFRSYRCAYHKSHPAILMMQSAQDRAADDIPGPLDAARDRGILVQ